jgi:hypothetical protein
MKSIFFASLKKLKAIAKHCNGIRQLETGKHKPNPTVT